MKIIIDSDLKLRSYNIKDKELLYINSTDKLFLKYMEFKKFSLKKFNAWLNRKLKTKNMFFFVIEYKNNPIGTYILTKFGIKNQNCDLSYGISSKYFGQKIFQKTTKKILEKFKNIKRFEAITRSDNLSSIFGLKKLKFKKEGVLKSYYYDLKTKKFYDAVILSYINKNK